MSKITTCEDDNYIYGFACLDTAKFYPYGHEKYVCMNAIYHKKNRTFSWLYKE